MLADQAVAERAVSEEGFGPDQGIRGRQGVDRTGDALLDPESALERTHLVLEALRPSHLRSAETATQLLAHRSAPRK